MSYSEQSDLISTVQIDALLLKMQAEIWDATSAKIQEGLQILHWSEQIQYGRGICVCCYLLSRHYCHFRNIPDAIRHAIHGLNVARAFNLRQDEALFLAMLGERYAMIGLNQQAIECFQQVSDVLEAQGNIEVELTRLNGMSINYLEIGEFDKAINTLEQLLLKADENGDLPTMFSAFCNMGSVKEKQSNYAEAIQYYERARQIASEGNYANELAAVIVGLADCHMALKHYHEAENLLKEVENLFLADDSMYKTDYLRSRGKLYRTSGAYTEAVNLLLQALNRADTVDDWYDLCRVYETLYEVYEVQGDFQNALQAFRAFQDLRSKVTDRDVQTRVKSLEIIYETKRLQHLSEINQLRADAADRELAEYKRTESDRIERERLEFIVEQEEKLARQKERVLSRIHHEFRTPVTIIGTSVELLTRYLNRLSPEAVEKHRQTISKQFKLIDRHLNDIGKVLRVHDQPLVEIQETIDWTDLCLSAVRQAEEQVHKEGRIQFGLGQMPSNPYVDPILLKEIMLQLLTNALKFSEGSVHFQLHETKDQLVIVVTDQGIGIPSDEIKDIFKPMYRATNLDEISGTGLGLTIVRAYVELLRGTISIESEPGSGSCFRVNIPLQE